MSKNGDKKKEALAATEPVMGVKKNKRPDAAVPDDGNPPQVGAVKQGQPLPPFMTGGQLTGMISTKEMPSALNMLGHPGDSPRQLSMRSVLQEKSNGTILATAYAYTMAADLEFHDTVSQEETLFQLALRVSDKGRGRTELVRAITGDREHEELKGGGMGAWLQKTAWGGGKKDNG
jgi:hypothetical protein